MENQGLADKASRGGGQAPHSDSEQGLAATSFQRSRTEQQPRTTAVIAYQGAPTSKKHGGQSTLAVFHR